MRMKRRHRCPMAVLVFAALAAMIAPGQELAPEVLLLARAKALLRQNLARLPDCTCLETLQRFYTPAGKSQTMRPLDTVRLEVLYSGG